MKWPRSRLPANQPSPGQASDRSRRSRITTIVSAKSSSGHLWAILCAAEKPTKVTIVFYGGPQCAITSKYYLEVIAPLTKPLRARWASSWANFH